MILLGSLIVTLASSTNVLYSTPACDAYCKEKGYVKGDLLGTAPFCGGSCSADCPNFTGDVTCIDNDTDKFKINSGCTLGRRSCCCKERPVNCAGRWSFCSQKKNCVKTFIVKIHPKNGGKACPTGANAERPCCAVDCVGEYQPCDATCMRRFKVTTASQRGGAKCKPDLPCSPGVGACPPVPTPRPVQPPTEYKPPHNSNWTPKVLDRPYVPPAGCTCREAQRSDVSAKFPATCTEDPDDQEIVCYVDPEEESCKEKEDPVYVDESKRMKVVCKEKQETPAQTEKPTEKYGNAKWRPKPLAKPHVPPAGCTCKKAQRSDIGKFPATCTEDPVDEEIICYVDAYETSCKEKEDPVYVSGFVKMKVVCKEKQETPVQPEEPAVQPEESESAELWDIDSLDKLTAWCSEAVANCRACRGKDQDDGTCKVRPRKLRFCKRFHGNAVCDRILGCWERTNRKGMKKCRGGKHGLE